MRCLLCRPRSRGFVHLVYKTCYEGELVEGKNVKNIIFYVLKCGSVLTFVEPYLIIIQILMVFYIAIVTLI